MSQRNLESLEREVSGRVRRNNLATGFFIATAASLLIPAFSVEGTRFEQTLFCFNPPNLTNPERHDYCTGGKIRRGIAWRVAMESANNQEFASKVSILKTIPAQNPHAGLFGLAAGGFLFVAYGFLKLGSHRIEDHLDVFIWNRKALILERAFSSDMHLSIEAQRKQNEEMFIKEMMSREHGEALLSLMSDGERQMAADRYAKGEKLESVNFDVQLATLKAQAAEQAEKEAKHLAEVAKLNKPTKKKDSGAEPTGDEAAKAELIEKLKDHEGGWLYTLVMTNKPVFVIGSQGSWKSYCSASIALARYYLKGQKLISIVDPHFNKNASESWKELISLEPECYGGAQDWAEVGEGIQAGFVRWNERTLKDEALTSIWDEQTNWALHDECVKEAKEFMGRVISDPRKANEAPLTITHSFTNAGTGGGGGFAQAREEGVLQLWLNSDNEMKPLFKGKLIGFKNEEGEVVEEMKITIPKDWFNPKAIAKLFEAGKS